ncbi:MAG: hypothetical protein V1686_00175 [Patescibacteria group bacterium]
MRKSVCVVLFIVLVVFSLPFSVFAQRVEPNKVVPKKVVRINSAPLKIGGVHNEQELMDLLNSEQEAIAVVFGHNDTLIKIFIQHLSGDIEIESRWFKKGDRFLSNIYRYNGKIFNVGEWEWAGEKPFDAFVFPIEQDLGDIIRQYWVVVIKDCANIVLWEIVDLPIPIEKVEERQVIPQREEREILEFPSRLSLKNDTKQPAQIDFFAGAGVGGFYSCFMEYGTIEWGVERQISGPVSVLASIGVGVPVGQNKRGWYTVPMVNLDLVGTLFEPVYLGAGIGFSGKMKEGQESQLEFGPTVGFRVGGVDFSFRGRVPFKGDPRGVKGNYKILLGMKIFF